MTPFTLEGVIINLIPFQDRHLSDRYVGWLNDPLVVKFSEQRHRRHSLESCREYVESCRTGNTLLWAIETKDSAHIGNISATIDQHNRIADVGILLGDRNCWGKGIGSEAFRLLVTFLLGEGNMRKITSGTMSENTAMLKLMKKAGMRREAVLEGYFLLDEKPVDMVISTITAL